MGNIPSLERCRQIQMGNLGSIYAIQVSKRFANEEGSTFLHAALNHFLSKQCDKARNQKWGSGSIPISLDS
jgi:hypothetical protein